MRGVAKIALGTALGIILAAVLLVVGGVVVIGASLGGGTAPSNTAASATPIAEPAPESERPSPASDPPAKRPRPRAAKRKSRPTLTSCDANIHVNAATTSCGFAQNVFLAYWMDYDSPGVFADSLGLPAYSAAVDEMFMVDCQGDPVVCKAGDGGHVTFPMSAVEAYTLADAERYVSSHDTGGVSPDGIAPAAGTDQSQDSGSDQCDPNYDGACLDPNSYDYDCEGGTGDGPDYTGMVEVVGDDLHDLDRDGDGIACDV